MFLPKVRVDNVCAPPSLQIWDRFADGTEALLATASLPFLELLSVADGDAASSCGNVMDGLHGRVVLLPLLLSGMRSEVYPTSDFPRSLRVCLGYAVSGPEAADAGADAGQHQP
jgi:hypothetical protein